MKKIVVGLAVVLGFCTCTHQPSGTLDVNKALDYCAKQTQRTLTELKTDSGIDYTMMPRNIMADEQHWNCRKATKEEWCAGFWPGVLWYDYEYTKDKQVLEEAENFTHSLKFLSHIPAYDHDLGFLVFCSYGNGYRLTKNPAYKQVILDTADTLATLFNPIVGTILSWPREVEPRNWPHNTIMDNMINLEMLFWAAKNGGNPYLYDIAVSHADKTMKNSNNNTYMFKGNETIKSVNDASFMFGKYVCRELEAIGMRSSYRHVMKPLMEQDGMTQLELVNLTQLKAPTISITLRNMEREGIVRREKNDVDRRETHVYITEKGREMHAKILEAFDRAEQLMLKDISEKEQATARKILAKMTENLRREVGGDIID